MQKIIFEIWWRNNSQGFQPYKRPILLFITDFD